MHSLGPLDDGLHDSMFGPIDPKHPHIVALVCLQVGGQLRQGLSRWNGVAAFPCSGTKPTWLDVLYPDRVALANQGLKLLSQFWSKGRSRGLGGSDL